MNNKGTPMDRVSKKLCRILARLNNIAGKPNLSTLINTVKRMPIDVKLKTQYDDAIKAWGDSDILIDRGIEELKYGLSKVIQGQSEIKYHQSNIVKSQSNIVLTQSKLIEGQSAIKESQSKLDQGQSNIVLTQSKLIKGQSTIKESQSKLDQGQSNIVLTQSKLIEGQSAIKESQSKLDQGQSNFVLTQSKLIEGQSAIKESQSKLNQGQSNIVLTQSKLIEGQSAIKESQSKLNQGQSNIVLTQSKLIEGQSAIQKSLSKLDQMERLQSLRLQWKSAIKEQQDQIAQIQSNFKHAQTIMIHGQSEIKDDQSKIVQGQSNIRHDQTNIIQVQSEIKDCLIDINESQQTTKRQLENVEQSLQERKPRLHIKSDIDVKKRLLTMYKEECSTLPVSSLCLDDGDGIELIYIYQLPNMWRIPYHKPQQEEDKCRISSYEELFVKAVDQYFKNVYITGDAGVGKTSFCKCMALLWSKQGVKIGNDKLQNNVDFMVCFDLVFYISLGKTVHDNVIDMIIDQYFYTRSRDIKEELVKLIEHVLQHKPCLIILDGLDEWSPIKHETNKYTLPRKCPSENSTYLITSRPYKLENVRLSQRDLGIQVSMTGISVPSAESFVKAIVNHVNYKANSNKNAEDCIKDITQVGLQEQLCIPMIASHLVEVWFDQDLTDMSRALLYTCIVNLLFKKSEVRKIKLPPPSTTCTVQVPDVLISFAYVKKHFSLLKKICLLSFRSIFKQDKNASALVYTKEQLMSEPYCLCSKEIDCLCKIGIVSINKVLGALGKQEQEVSFLHKSYTEYFAALFVASFDSNAAFDNIVKTWNTINEVVQYSDFFSFLFGLSCQRSKILLEHVYNAISEDMTLHRLNMIVHPRKGSYRKQMESLQSMIINCFKETTKSNNPSISCKIKDVSFDKNDTDRDLLSQLLQLNRKNIQSLRVVNGDYCENEFGPIRKLHCLYVQNVSPLDYEKFVQIILNNKSTLHTIGIAGRRNLIQPLPVKYLNHLTTLSMTDIIMEHDSLDTLVRFLSNNVLFTNINLSAVACQNHRLENSDCTFTLNLPRHAELNSLSLEFVNVLCNKVKNSKIKYLRLSPLSKDIVSCYIDILDCIRFSSLEHLEIKGHTHNWFDSITKKELLNTVKILPCIESLSLYQMELPDDDYIQFCDCVHEVEVQLIDVTMSCKCFRSFIKALVNNKKCVIRLWFEYCTMISFDGGYRRKMELKESLDYMHDYLTSEKALRTMITEWQIYVEKQD